MAEKYFVDSSAAIKYLNNSLPHSAIRFLDKEFDREINLSIVAKVELLVWEPPQLRDAEIVKAFTDNANVFPVNDFVADVSIKIRKLTKIKLPDVFIAATALTNNAILLADNDKDFNKIVELDIGFKYINVNAI